MNHTTKDPESYNIPPSYENAADPCTRINSKTHKDEVQDSDNPTTYPEGGWAAWSVVLGSWMATFGTMGIMNSVGIFEAYMKEHQLQDYSAGQVGWIFGLYTFFAFFCGIQVGPIFDTKGPRILVLGGAVGTTVFLVLLGFCTAYWHFMLVFGLLGVSLSLAFNPAISIVAHYFNRRRAFATGVASSGASVGGVIFPLVFQALVSKVGFAWATRSIALIDLIAFIPAIILIRPRTQTKKTPVGAVLLDFSAFRDVRLMLASMGIFFMEWGLFTPIAYLVSYALSHGASSQFAYLLLSLVNVGAVFGRWIPGYCADRIGRFNTLIISIFGCLLSVLALWMLAGSSAPIMIAFAVLFGFASGSNVSLAPVCVGQLCKIEAYGRYYATACLTSFPIAGEILNRCNGEYWGLIAFTAVSYAVSLVCLVLTKLFCCGRNQIAAFF
ncbi:major facilitator superfamily domain-containing protein [Aspergillus cavernicola]|uniref:Major facilitator superfamily domain-containing protein n=1 Tax=Aspergillus cavernicola TaxID=176166 RepID=A0ABR4HAQ5_9EURO